MALKLSVDMESQILTVYTEGFLIKQEAADGECSFCHTKGETCRLSEESLVPTAIIGEDYVNVPLDSKLGQEVTSKLSLIREQCDRIHCTLCDQPLTDLITEILEAQDLNT